MAKSKRTPEWGNGPFGDGHYCTHHPDDPAHGPRCYEPYNGFAPCPRCFESSGYAARVHHATWDEPAWADADPTQPCPECDHTGYVECESITLNDLEEMAIEEEMDA